MSAGTLYVAIKGDTKELTKALRDAEIKSKTSARKTKDAWKPVDRSINTLRNSVIALGAVWAGAKGLGVLVKITDQYAMIDSKLKLVTDGSDSFNKTYQELYKISQKTGTSFATNAEVYSNLQLQLKDTGIEAETTLDMFDTMTKSLVVNGSSTNETASFMLQLKQALGSGVLAGDEFRGVLEGNAYWATQLADALGTDVAGLRAMSKEQELTRDKIIDASKVMAEQIDKDFDRIQKTIRRAMTELRNAVEGVVSEGNKAADGTSSIAKEISNLAEIIDKNRDTYAAVFSGIIKGATVAVGAVGRVTRSIQGLAVVAASGQVDIFDWITASPEEMERIIEDADAGLLQLQDLRDKARKEQHNLFKQVRSEKNALFGADEEEIERLERQKEIQGQIVEILDDKIALIESQRTGLADLTIEAETYKTKHSQAEEQLKDAIKTNTDKVVKIKKDAQWEILSEQKIINQEYLKEEEETAKKIEKITADKKKKVLTKEESAQKQRKEVQERVEKEITDLQKDSIEAVVDAFVKGEDAKTAAARVAKDYISDWAIEAATEHLAPIIEAIAAQVGAWVGLGVAETSTEGKGWKAKLGNAAKYLAEVGISIAAGKAIGDTMYASGGWLGSHPQGGMINTGSGLKDDVFLGYTDGGATRNWGMRGEMVMNKQATAKYYPILEAWNRGYAEGGPVADAWGPTRAINDSGFDAFWKEVLTTKGNWKKAIGTTIGYYAGTGLGMIAGKELGPDIFMRKGGLVRDRGFLFGGWLDDLLDPFGLSDELEQINEALDPVGTWIMDEYGSDLNFGTLWDMMRELPIVDDTVKRADRILYPFVRDALTPGKSVTWNTFEDMLTQTYEGLGDELASWLTVAITDPGVGAIGALGSFSGGTDRIERDGMYYLHEGESVNTAAETRRGDPIAIHIHGKDLNACIDRVVVERNRQNVPADVMVYN